MSTLKRRAAIKLFRFTNYMKHPCRFWKGGHDWKIILAAGTSMGKTVILGEDLGRVWGYAFQCQRCHASKRVASRRQPKNPEIDFSAGGDA